MMRRGIKADAGQLLFLLDAYDFAVFLRRFSSSRRSENYQTFEDVMQWQNTKAVKRTKVALPVVR